MTDSQTERTSHFQPSSSHGATSIAYDFQLSCATLLSPLAPTELTGLYRRLMALYELRLDAQYRALAVPPGQAQHGIQTAFDVMEHVRHHKFGEAS